jgi:hypothetical protein
MNINMSQGTLSFNLPEQRQEFMDAFNGTSWKIAVLDIVRYLERENDNETSPSKYKLRSEILTFIYDTLNDSHLFLHD